MYLSAYRFAADDCSGDPYASVVLKVSGLGLLSSAYAGKCIKGTRYQALSSSEPEMNVYGMSITYFNTKEGCYTGKQDADYQKIVVKNGYCMGGYSASCTSATSFTYTTYSDSKCQNVDSTLTKDLTSKNCLDGDERYLVYGCVVQPPAKETDNSLAIGLGVGLGGGALLIGGGLAFYYFKVVKTPSVYSPAKVIPVAVAEAVPTNGPATIELSQTA
jgi:hypothetical protein